MNKLKRIQTRARKLAHSGEFHGWHPIAFELRFEDGFEEAREWLYRALSRCRRSVTVNVAGNRRHAAADAAAQVRNEPARSSLKFARRSR